MVAAAAKATPALAAASGDRRAAPSSLRQMPCRTAGRAAGVSLQRRVVPPAARGASVTARDDGRVRPGARLPGQRCALRWAGLGTLPHAGSDPAFPAPPRPTGRCRARRALVARRQRIATFSIFPCARPPVAVSFTPAQPFHRSRSVGGARRLWVTAVSPGNCGVPEGRSPVDKPWTAAVAHRGLRTNCAQTVDKSLAPAVGRTCPQLVPGVPGAFHKALTG